MNNSHLLLDHIEVYTGSADGRLCRKIVRTYPDIWLLDTNHRKHMMIKEIEKFILSSCTKKDLDPYYTDDYPLFITIRYDEYTLAKILLHAGADPNHITAYDEPLIDVSVRCRAYSITRLLIDAGGKFYDKDVYGCNPLDSMSSGAEYEFGYRSEYRCVEDVMTFDLLIHNLD